MAVYKRSYKSYTGTLTPEWSRFWIIPRYAWKSLFQQRFLTILYVACFFYPLGAALAIYFNHNLSFLRQYVQVPQGGLFKIENTFFFIFLTVQSTMGFILATFIGPGLISPDLTNNALPLYFCRPLSRTGYVVGKGLVIAALLSLVTWIPGLALFALQASLADQVWWDHNAYLAGSILGCSALWIVTTTVMAMALSAWVRWKIIAGGLMLAVLFIGAAMAEMVHQVAKSDVGAYFDLAGNLSRVWIYLFRMKSQEVLTLEESVGCLVLFCAFCVFLLTRKVKAYEVVR